MWYSHQYDTIGLSDTLTRSGNGSGVDRGFQHIPVLLQLCSSHGEALDVRRLQLDRQLGSHLEDCVDFLTSQDHEIVPGAAGISELN